MRKVRTKRKCLDEGSQVEGNSGYIIITIKVRFGGPCGSRNGDVLPYRGMRFRGLSRCDDFFPTQNYKTFFVAKQCTSFFFWFLYWEINMMILS